MLTRSLLEVKMVEISGWSEFFKEISTLVDGAERQYGIANLNYSDYVMERLELSISTCFNLLEAINNSTELEECLSSLTELFSIYKPVIEDGVNTRLFCKAHLSVIKF